MTVRGVLRAMIGGIVVVPAILGLVGCARYEQSAEQVPATAPVQGPTGARLPEGYQSADCPLPEGELLSAIGSDGTYVLTYTVEDAAAFDELLTRYTALGYEQVSSEAPGMFKAATLTGDRWRVELAYPEVAGFTLTLTAKLT